MEQLPGTDLWATRLAAWSKRLHAARLDGLVNMLLDIVEPLSPLGAQVLWVSQPTLGLLMPREEITTLARLLEQPDGMAWVREQLTGSEKDHHGK